MPRRTNPNKTHEGPGWNRPDNPPRGPTGPSPDRIRRLNSQRYHPARYLGSIPEPGPKPDRGPRANPHRYTSDRFPHPLVAHRPMPPVIHDPEHTPHPEPYVDAGGQEALRVESPIRPPMRLTRDGRIKPRDFGRRS